MNRLFSRLKQAVISFLLFSTVTFPFFSADNNNKLKVGFLTDMPYFMNKDSDNGYMYGYGYDYLQMIANYTGWEYEYTFIEE